MRTTTVGARRPAISVDGAWELEGTPEGHPKVTHTYDRNGVRDQDAPALYPRVSQEQMSGSLQRIGDAVR